MILAILMMLGRTHCWLWCFWGQCSRIIPSTYVLVEVCSNEAVAALARPCSRARPEPLCLLLPPTPVMNAEAKSCRSPVPLITRLESTLGARRMTWLTVHSVKWSGPFGPRHWYVSVKRYVGRFWRAQAVVRRNLPSESCVKPRVLQRVLRAKPFFRLVSQQSLQQVRQDRSLSF